MKWLKSSTSKTWTVGIKGKQVIVPAAEGKWLKLEEEEYNEMSSLPVVAGLIKVKDIIVLDHKPVELEDSIPELQDTNIKLQDELNTALQRVNELEAKLATASADKEAALAELDAKASQIISEKDATIADLESKVGKLEKKLKKEGVEE